MGLSNKLCCEAGSFSRHDLYRILQPEVFEAFFSCTGTLGCMVCLTPQLFLPVSLHATVVPPVAALPSSSLSRMPVSAPHTSLDGYFLFNSLFVGLPYSSVVVQWQFWIFFLFLNLLSSFWLCEEAKCIFLHLHLGLKSNTVLFQVTLPVLCQCASPMQPVFIEHTAGLWEHV